MNPLNIFKKGLTKKEYQKLLTTFGIIFIVSALLTFLIIPVIVRAVIGYTMVMKPGHYLRNLHKKLPIHVKFYLWNITNSDEILSGGKPVMQEVGPYVFDMTKEKFNQEDNDKDDTFSYDLWNTYHFRQDLSAPLTGDENLVMLNNILVAGAVKFRLEKPPMVNFMEAAMKEIFDDPTSIFINVKAREILFEGVTIDCDRKSFAAKSICSFIKKNKLLIDVEQNRKYNFALLNEKNNTLFARYTINRGGKNIHDMGNLEVFNGESQLDIFEGDMEHCNKINGTDMNVFPGKQTDNDVVWLFAAEACRSIVARYHGHKRVKGIKTTAKDVDFDDELMPLECNKNKYISIPRGSLDLYPCYEIFMLVTFPHFYLVEDAVQKSVEGFSPNKDLHSTRMYFDLETGAPIIATERAQINTKILPIPEYNLMKNVPDVFIPFYWYEDHFVLDKTSRSLILLAYYARLITYIIGSTLMISVALSAAGATFIYMQNKIPTTPEQIGHDIAHEVIEDAIREINNKETNVEQVPENEQQ